MTSTKTFGGIDTNSRNSSKVLKPPGGGSSDIFGTSSSATPEAAGTTGRRVMKNHQASSVFLSDEPDNKVAMTPGRNAGQGRDTHSRLFGTPPPALPSASKNRMRSNILQEAAQMEDAVNQNSVEPEQEEAANGVSVEELDNTDTAHMNGGSGGSENSLNGIGGGDEPPARLTNGNPSGVMNGNPPSGQQTPARARVPPGGFSSGLW